MRVKGLECLVAILKCLVQWSHDLYINPITTGLNAVTNFAQGSSLVGGPIPMEKNNGSFDESDFDQVVDTSATTLIKDTPASNKDTTTNLRGSHLRGASIALSHPATYQDHGIVAVQIDDKLSSSQTSLNSATDDPQQFESQRQRKEIMEQGMTL